MMDRLAVSRTFRNWAFAATTAHTNPVYDITLFGLVTQSPRFIRPGGAGSPVQRRELAVLPAADPQKKAHHIGLLLPPQLLDVLVCTHLGLPSRQGWVRKTSTRFKYNETIRPSILVLTSRRKTPGMKMALQLQGTGAQPPSPRPRTAASVSLAQSSQKHYAHFWSRARSGHLEGEWPQPAARLQGPSSQGDVANITGKDGVAVANEGRLSRKTD